MDASSGMLEQAKAKLADAISNNTVDGVIENKLPNIPFANGSFDAVLFSLVSIRKGIANTLFNC